MASARNPIPKNADIPATVSNTLQNVESIRVADAINDDRLELYYQPIIRSDTNSFVAFYEGLARIMMPDGAVISAGQFMPFIENTQLGTRLDRRILHMALAQLDNDPDIRLSINISVLSMKDTRWLSILEVAETELCERLIIEITEGTPMTNTEQTAAFFAQGKAKTL